MLKSATTLLAALTVGWMLFGSPTSASANEDCDACKPTKEIRHGHKQFRPEDITITHHQKKYQHVPVKHTIITVVPIQPVRRIHEVTIVDHYKVPEPYYVRETTTEVLPEISEVVSHKTINRYHGCGCGGGGSYGRY